MSSVELILVVNQLVVYWNKLVIPNSNYFTWPTVTKECSSYLKQKNKH